MNLNKLLQGGAPAQAAASSMVVEKQVGQQVRVVYSSSVAEQKLGHRRESRLLIGCATSEGVHNIDNLTNLTVFC